VCLLVSSKLCMLLLITRPYRVALHVYFCHIGTLELSRLPVVLTNLKVLTKTRND
jgi:hypothetical protein